MCGFSGIFRWDAKPIDRSLLKKMAGTIRHRGPDDEGFFISDADGSGVRAGFGFRRLSVIDLSTGNQPMTTAQGKSWIVFNGEIYNFPELKKELENRGRTFQTRSDTEVILHLYELYGPQCVDYLRGMFAFAIWDSSKKSLFLARDRIGKKPLFYATINGALVFASELKAILQCGEVPQKVRLDSIPFYLTYQFIPSPMTVFEGIQRLPPGHTLVCDGKGTVQISRYWKISRSPKTTKSVKEISEELLHHLREATKIRLISDVPLGAFLSGGIDSSAVVGMMAQEMKEPVKTFSIGFEESDFSELKHARVVADHFRTDHREFIVKPQMAELLPKLAWHYDQPFGDPSALPSYYVARETRKHVTVALNGDGGDEAFGGYRRYQADKIFYALSKVPAPLRTVFSTMPAHIPASWQRSHFWRRAARAGSILNSTPHEFNFRLFCYFDQKSLQEILEKPLPTGDRSVYDYYYSLYNESDSEEFMDQVLACDAGGYLPDCLLIKMDIASMANSLEARSPFLDHKMIEFAAKIPSRYKVKFNGGKWILKESLKGFLPDQILERKKMGFGIPLSDWFKGPLKDFLRDTLLNRAALERGYFKPREVQRLIEEHQSGRRDHGYKLWALLMFELWCKVFIDKGYDFGKGETN